MIGFVFTSAPFGRDFGREGLDALLAFANFSDDAALFFLGDGVLQILAGQDPSKILVRDHVKTFKMLSLYDISQRYICQTSLAERGLSDAPRVIDVTPVDPALLAKKMAACKKLLRF
ncbi:MAG: sulfurtransferase complex subunit TusC [Vibrionaceae bacterium]